MSRLLPEPLQALRRRLLLRVAHRHGMPLQEGNALGLLPGGDAILDATVALIRGAQRDIRFEMYIWSDDAVGREVLGVLLEALRRGAVVRGLVDGVGGWGAAALIKEARQAGADIRWFHPVAAWRPRLWNRRNHRKLLIVDGQEALVGSANWGLDYRPSLNDQAFLDLGLVVRGPSVGDLVEDFQRAWFRSEGDYPSTPEKVEGERIWKGSWREGALVQVVSSVAPGGRRALRRHFGFLLTQVQQELAMAHAYFLPSRMILKRIRHLARRGRKVILVLPGTSDQPFVQAASRHVYGPLLEAGVRIFEREEHMLHAKAALVDRFDLFTGSANLDPRSFRHNLELNLFVRQKQVAEDAARILEAQCPLSQEISLETWKRRSSFNRAWSWFAYQFRWWL